MRKIVSFLLIFFYFVGVFPINNIGTKSANADGPPTVSGVTGNMGDGDSITISGLNFGAHNLDIEWNGGSSGIIETATTGQVPLDAVDGGIQMVHQGLCIRITST